MELFIVRGFFKGLKNVYFKLYRLNLKLFI